jgi:hypothetical protein
MDVLLLRPYASAGTCLLSRCRTLGLYIRIYKTYYVHYSCFTSTCNLFTDPPSYCTLLYSQLAHKQTKHIGTAVSPDCRFTKIHGPRKTSSPWKKKFKWSASIFKVNTTSTSKLTNHTECIWVHVTFYLWTNKLMICMTIFLYFHSGRSGDIHFDKISLYLFKTHYIFFNIRAVRQSPRSKWSVVLKHVWSPSDLEI